MSRVPANWRAKRVTSLNQRPSSFSLIYFKLTDCFSGSKYNQKSSQVGGPCMLDSFSGLAMRTFWQQLKAEGGLQSQTGLLSEPAVVLRKGFAMLGMMALPR